MRKVPRFLPRLTCIGVLALALSGCIGAGTNSSVVPKGDMNFPFVVGTNLNGESFKIPAELEGDPRILVVAFEQAQQGDVDTWIRGLQSDLAARPELRLYELPVIYTGSAAFRFTVNNGMRSGITDETARRRTITVYTDRDAFYAALNVKQSSITTFVINKSGAIVWRADGPATEESLGSLRAVLAAQG